MTKRKVSQVDNPAYQDHEKNDYIEQLEDYKNSNSSEIYDINVLIHELESETKDKVNKALKEYSKYQDIDNHLINANFLKYAKNNMKEIFDYFKGFKELESKLNDWSNIFKKKFEFKYNKESEQEKLIHEISKDESKSLVIDFEENLQSSRNNRYEHYIGERAFLFNDKDIKLFNELKEALIERKELFDDNFHKHSLERIEDLAKRKWRNVVELENLSHLDEEKLSEIFDKLKEIPNLDLKLFERLGNKDDYSDKINDLLKNGNVIKLDLSSKGNKGNNLNVNFAEIFKDIKKFNELNISGIKNNSEEINNLIRNTYFKKIDVTKTNLSIAKNRSPDVIIENPPREISLNLEQYSNNSFPALQQIKSPIKINIITEEYSFNNEVYKDLKRLYESCKKLKGYDEKKISRIDKDLKGTIKNFFPKKSYTKDGPQKLFKTIDESTFSDKVLKKLKGFINYQKANHPYGYYFNLDRDITSIESCIDDKNKKIEQLLSKIESDNPDKFKDILNVLREPYSYGISRNIGLWDNLYKNPYIEFTTNNHRNKNFNQTFHNRPSRLEGFIIESIESIKDKDFKEQNRIINNISIVLEEIFRIEKKNDNDFKYVFSINEDKFKGLKDIFSKRLAGLSIEYKKSKKETDNYTFFDNSTHNSGTKQLHLCDLVYLNNYMMNIETPRDKEDIPVHDSKGYPKDLAIEHELFRRKTELENGTYKAPIGNHTRSLLQAGSHNHR